MTRMVTFKPHTVKTGLLRIKRHKKFYSLLCKELKLGIEGGIDGREIERDRRRDRWRNR